VDFGELNVKAIKGLTYLSKILAHIGKDKYIYKFYLD
jgi:hypothetical protein